LLSDFNSKKDREMKAKYERDEINKALRTLEKSKLTALENDRQKELQRLADERENIRLQE